MATMREDSSASGAGRGWLRWARVALAVGLLVYVVGLARPDRLWEAVTRARYAWALAGVVFALLSTWLDAVRLHLLMVPFGFGGGLWGVFRTTLVVNYVSLFLPGTVGGGAVAWYRLSRPEGLRAQALAALAANAGLKAAAVFGVGAAALALDAGALGDSQAWLALLWAGAAAALGGTTIMLWTGAATWAKGFVLRLGRWAPRRLVEAGVKVMEAFERYRGARGAALGALAASVASRAVGNAFLLFALYAVGVDMSYARVLWITCVMEAVGMLPLTPSAIGLTQVTQVGLMGLFGVSADRALAANLMGWLFMAPVYAAGALVTLREAAGTPGPAEQDRG